VTNSVVFLSSVKQLSKWPTGSQHCYCPTWTVHLHLTERCCRSRHSSHISADWTWHNLPW